MIQCKTQTKMFSLKHVAMCYKFLLKAIKYFKDRTHYSSIEGLTVICFKILTLLIPNII